MWTLDKDVRKICIIPFSVGKVDTYFTDSNIVLVPATSKNVSNKKIKQPHFNKKVLMFQSGDNVHTERYTNHSVKMYIKKWRLKTKNSLVPKKTYYLCWGH